MLSRLETVTLLYNKILFICNGVQCLRSFIVARFKASWNVRVIIGKPGGKTNIAGFNAKRALFNRYISSSQNQPLEI